jgi:hypothetical protein
LNPGIRQFLRVETMEEDRPDIQRALLQSFAAVVSGALIATLGYFLLISIAVLAFSAEARSMLLSAPTSQNSVQEAQTNRATKQQSESHPDGVAQSETSRPAHELAIPVSVFAICPFLQIAVGALGGYVTGRLAPSAILGHGGLVAAFVLFTYAQLLLKPELTQPVWLIAINIVAGPACVMWGAAKAERQRLKKTGTDSGQVPRATEEV